MVLAFDIIGGGNERASVASGLEIEGFVADVHRRFGPAEEAVGSVVEARKDGRDLPANLQDLHAVLQRLKDTLDAIRKQASVNKLDVQQRGNLPSTLRVFGALVKDFHAALKKLKLDKRGKRIFDSNRGAGQYGDVERMIRNILSYHATFQSVLASQMRPLPTSSRSTGSVNTARRNGSNALASLEPSEPHVPYEATVPRGIPSSRVPRATSCCTILGPRTRSRVPPSLKLWLLHRSILYQDSRRRRRPVTQVPRSCRPPAETAGATRTRSCLPQRAAPMLVLGRSRAVAARSPSLARPSHDLIPAAYAPRKPNIQGLLASPTRN